MRNRCLGDLLALSLVALAASPLAAQTGTIAGRVTSAETGAALHGAQVEAVSPDGGTVASSLADAQGRYRLSDLPAGTYSVTASLIGYSAGRVTGVEVTAGGAVMAPAIALQPQAVLLNPVVVSASKRQEKAIEAPARVEVVGTQAITDRPATSVVDHLRNTPAVDVITQGIGNSNVVVRGFNNLYSGALMVLTDNRIASQPSLRNNSYSLIPATDEDIERMEVVLGPGSALYGPNTANGVLHIMTKSPLNEQGSVATIGGGERNIFTSSFRTAQLVGENLGVKVSGQYFRGQEWEHEEPNETALRKAALSQDPNTLIGARNHQLESWRGEVRADWRITPDLTTVFSAGTAVADGITLHGVGASQVDDWTQSYYQARMSYKRLFGQVYMNTTSAGDSYQLWTGLPILDESRMVVAQLQNGTSLGDRQSFTYGVDYIRTMPDTKGTLHGVNEENDVTDEFGAYLQSETKLSDKFDVVLAGRIDNHSNIEEPVFSPRAALVFKPTENQSLRATYNRAFSTPGPLQFFLDFDVGAAPSVLGQMGYRFHLMGNDGGYPLMRSSGFYSMRSPFNPAGASAVMDARSSTMYQMAVGVLQKMGKIDARTAAYLMSLQPQDSDIGIGAMNIITKEVTPLTAGALADIPALDVSNNQTFEIGYKGLLGDRVLLAADVWYSKIDNFISRPQLSSPLLFLSGADLAKFFQGKLPPASAQALAAGMAQLPLGVISPEKLSATAADFLITYVNFGEVDLYGADLSARALLTDRWSLGVTASLVSDEYFQNEQTDGELIPLNAPDKKGSVSLGYRNEDSGFNSELRVRYTGDFAASTGVHIADQCINPNSLSSQPCIDAYTIADVTMGYRVRRNTSLQLSVANLFDTPYVSFAGVPEVGRLALLRLRYEF